MGLFDDLIPTEGGTPAAPAKKQGLFDDLVPAAPPASPERTLGGTLKDVGIDAVKGLMSVPEAAVGLADIPTGGRVGQALEGVGFRPKEAKQAWEQLYSPARQAAGQRFAEAEGITGKFRAAVENPSVVASAVVESLPLVAAGGGGARGLGAVSKLSTAARAAIGEGAVGAGMQAEGIRQETEDGRLTAKQAGLAALTGVGTAAFGYAGGKMAQKLGIADIDVLAAGGGAEGSKGLVRRTLEGAVTEGFLEELPQSVQEQVLQNAALGKDLSEGIDEAAVLGTLSGGVMGATASAFAKPRTAEIAKGDKEASRRLSEKFPEAEVKVRNGFATVRPKEGPGMAGEAAAILEDRSEDIFIEDVQGDTPPTPGAEAPAPQELPPAAAAGRDKVLADLEASKRKVEELKKAQEPSAQDVNPLTPAPNSAMLSETSSGDVDMQALPMPSQTLTKTASWVLRNKETGEVIAETFDKKKVDALNTEKYEAVPIYDYLVGLNKKKGTPPPQGAIPEISAEEALEARKQVVAELATVDPKDEDRVAQLEIQLGQYEAIASGEAEAKDFAPAPVEPRTTPPPQKVKQTDSVETAYAKGQEFGQQDTGTGPVENPYNAPKAREQRDAWFKGRNDAVAEARKEPSPVAQNATNEANPATIVGTEPTYTPSQAEKTTELLGQATKSRPVTAFRVTDEAAGFKKHVVVENPKGPKSRRFQIVKEDGSVTAPSETLVARYEQLKKEGKVEAVDPADPAFKLETENPDGSPTILVNPTRSELRAFINATKSGEVRIVKDPVSGTTYAADAGKTTHDWIAERAGVPWASVAGNPDYMFFESKRSLSEVDPLAQAFMGAAPSDPIASMRQGISKYLKREVAENDYTPAPAPQAFAEVQAGLEEATGKKIVFFSQGENAPIRIGGVTNIAPDTIFINAKSKKPHLTIFGHELLHNVERDAPEIYEEFLTALKSVSPVGAMTRYKKGLDASVQAEGRGPAPLRMVESEFAADAFGERMVEAQFWEKVRRQMDGSAFEKLVFKIQEVLARLKAAVRNDAVVSDIEKVQDAAARAFARYAKTRKTQAPAGEASLAREAGASTENQKDLARKEWLEKGVESRWFKKWFGDSKVVDAEGKPLVVYHGTGNDIGTFDRSKIRMGLGFFFTKSKATAKGYADRYVGAGKGNVIPVYLSLQNPIDLSTPEGRIVNKEIKAAISGDLRGVEYKDAFVQEAQSRGYDGMLMLDGKEYVAFSPTQIKSATGNQGSFDPENPDIRFSREQVFYHGTDRDFDAFAIPSWFTTDPSTAGIYAGSEGANIRPVVLTLENPYEVEAFDDIIRVTPGMVRAMKSAGFDGMSHTAPDGHTTAVPFGAEQVRGLFEQPSFSREPKQFFDDLSVLAKSNLANIRNLKPQTAKYWLKAVPLPHVAELFSARLPQLTAYYRKTQEFTAAQNGIVDGSMLKHQAVRKAARSAADIENLNASMAAGSWYQMTPWVDIDRQEWVGRQYLGKGREAIEAAEKLWQESGMPAKTDGASYEQAYEAAQKAYQRLPEAMRKAHREVVADLHAIRERERAGAEALIIRMTEDGSEAREQMLREFDRLYSDLKGAYVPLARFGDYVATGVNPKTGAVEREQFDTIERRDLAAQAMADRGFTDVRRFKNPVRDKLDQQIPIEFVRRVQDLAEQEVGKEEAEEMARALQEMWIKWQPETSALKNAMQRKNVAGYNTDLLRGWLNYSVNHARNIAFTEHGRDLQQLLTDMQNEVKAKAEEGEAPDLEQAIVDDLKARQATLRQSRSNAISRLLGTVSSFYYMTSPSMYLVQLSQNWVVTFPRLATRYGLGAAKALMRNTHIVNRKFTKEKVQAPEIQKLKETLFGTDPTTGEPIVSEPLRKRALEGLSDYDRQLVMLARAIDDNVLDITLSHEALDVAQGRERDKGYEVMHKMMFFMRESELASRRAALLAAFDLEMGKSKDFYKAYEQARETAVTTLFDYSYEAKAPVMQGPIGRATLQFQTYPINMAFRLGRLVHQSLKALDPEARVLARKEFAGIMGMTFLLAGSAGLPFAGMLFKALDLAGDDDEPLDHELLFEQWLTEMVGQRGARGITQGVPSMFGMNLSRRIGLSDSFSLPGADAPEWLHGSSYAAWLAAQAVGPWYSVVDGWARGYDQMVNKGEYLQGLISATPKPIKDGLKAYRLASEGLKDGQGKRLLAEGQVGADDLFLLAVGFYPEDLAFAQQTERRLDTMSTKISERRGRLLRDFARAVEADDASAMDEAIDAVTAFNKKMPAFALRSSELRQAWLKRAKGDLGTTGLRESRVAEQYGLPVVR